ncbi:hypothetical protein O181_031650 [Austropuccinia psidii MF-1]|uniref:Uncharacterized protein n=1 Tax=Austropuccinia psidii MF-1 TaxID=1389203 RepID=A0A9Q3H7F8_9BASI|nr:hypothetical protein [Austropuccinia psidii MF-1]
MGSKLTELTESSLCALPPSVLHGSGSLSQFSSPSMASSGNFDPTQIYDSYKAVEVHDPACTKSSKVRRFLWSKKDGPFGKEFPVSEPPTVDGTSEYSAFTGSRKRDVARWTDVGGPIPVGGRQIYSISEVPISRINTEGILKRRRQNADSPPDPDAEGSNELDGEEVEVIPHSTGHPSNISPSQPPAKRFQIRPSPIQQSRNSPIVNSQQLQPVASTTRRRDELSPFPFPASQVFQHRDQLPIQVTREDPNTVSDNQDSVARFFRRVDRDSREVIMYANDRTIPGTASGRLLQNLLGMKMS